MPLRQLALQAGVVFLILSLAWPYYGIHGEVMPWRETALLIGGLSGLVAVIARQPWWWCLLHTIFMPMAWLVAQLQLDPGWFLFAFIALLLVYRGAVSGQVPLYLSNTAAVDAVRTLLEQGPAAKILDLGAGVGSLILPLARQFPDARLVGVENAPLTWLLGWIRSRASANVDWRWADLWRISLAEFDLVYAFLSPVPMAELWDKVRAEMRPGSLFVSNSFAVPEIEPDERIELEGGHTLFVYRVPQ